MPIIRVKGGTMAKGFAINRLTQPDRSLRESAPVLLVRVNEMMEWSTSIHDPARVTELHNMRIAAKRLRYTLELFAPTLGPEALKLLKIAEDIQEQIGLIHDCDVLLPLLHATLEKEMNRERKQALKKGGGPPPFLAAEGLVALMARKRQEREKRYRDFLAYWDKLPPEGIVERFTRLVALPEDMQGTNDGAAA
jgi:CHAD domain-containing protein